MVVNLSSFGTDFSQPVCSLWSWVLYFHIAINANSCGRKSSMISYPNLHGRDRALQIFNLDVFFNACADAKVICKHVIIYRDPYDVIQSTTVNRAFNHNIYNAIRLYTSAMQQIHSQMVSHPDGNMGCFGFLDVEGHELRQDWEQFGNLFGWGSFESFMDHANMITKKNRTPMLEEMRANLIPSRLSDRSKRGPGNAPAPAPSYVE